LLFTPDGKFVGDLGEAIAASHFGIRLEQSKHIDGYSPCGREVQVKATGRKDGQFQFRPSDYQNAEDVHLLAFYIDWEDCSAELVFNGPEKLVRPVFNGTIGSKNVSVAQLRRATQSIDAASQLQPVSRA
jgi:hypothetical protein